MVSKRVRNTNAVFSTDVFDREWQTNGGDTNPPPGGEFALALGDAFIKAGWKVAQMDEGDGQEFLWWEHTYWFLFLTYADREYFVQIEPIEHKSLWRVGFSARRGCLASIFGSRRDSLLVSESLQAEAHQIIERLAACTDLRWVTEDEAVAMW